MQDTEFKNKCHSEDCTFIDENYENKIPSCVAHIENMINLIPDSLHNSIKVKTFFRDLVSLASQTPAPNARQRIKTFLSSFIETTVDLEKIGKKPYLGCFAEESMELFMIQRDFHKSFRALLARLDKDIEDIKVKD